MTKTALAANVLVFGLVAVGLGAQDREAARRALIARGNSLELHTNYVPPPGEKIEHYASGYAKVMCTAVFVTGLDPAFAAENVGYFTAPYEERAKLGTPKIDRQKQTVEVTMPNGTVRVAKRVASQAAPSPDSDAAARPRPSVSPMSPGGRPRLSRWTPISTAENPNPNARRPRATSSRPRSTAETLGGCFGRAPPPNQQDSHHQRDQRQDGGGDADRTGPRLADR